MDSCCEGVPLLIESNSLSRMMLGMPHKLILCNLTVKASYIGAFMQLEVGLLIPFLSDELFLAIKEFRRYGCQINKGDNINMLIIYWRFSWWV